MQKTITYSKWVEQYKPVTNPDGSLKRIDEFEARQIATESLGRVWTMLDDGETDWIASGIHFVNRIDYVLTEVALEDGIDHIDVVDEHPEPAVWKLAHGDYELVDGSGWFDVKGFTVYIHATVDGVVAEIFDAAELRDGDIDAVVASLRLLVRNALLLMLPVAYIRPVCSRGTCLSVLLSIVANPLRHSMAFAA